MVVIMIAIYRKPAAADTEVSLEEQPAID
jgi:hypothetical protein